LAKLAGAGHLASAAKVQKSAAIIYCTSVPVYFDSQTGNTAEAGLLPAGSALFASYRNSVKPQTRRHSTET
jgi:hypothetical protein